jgi:hypothetical protein
MAKPSYGEGDWFAVPLRDGGFGVGVIARANRNGVLLGFFFSPKHAEPPARAAVAALEPGDAVLVRRFGHLGLKNGTWPVLGPAGEWDRELWSVTRFGRREPLRGLAFVEVYDDDDPNKHVATERATAEEVDRLPEDGLSGAGAIEVRLGKLLS